LEFTEIILRYPFAFAIYEITHLVEVPLSAEGIKSSRDLQF